MRIVNDDEIPTFSSADTAHIETEFTFEDGRTGVLAADLRIEDAEVSTPPPLKKAS